MPPDPLNTVFDLDTPTAEAEEAFVLSSEVEEVAQRMLGRHLVLARLKAEARIAYCLHVGKQPEHGQSRESTIDNIAKAMKAPKIWQSLSGYDAVVVVNDMAWQALGDRQREAVVLHELLHLDVGDNGQVRVLKHDVEEFGLVAATYGPWHGALERFGEQLRMFEAQPVH